MGNVDRTTWPGRFSLLSPWFSEIIGSIKRDCKAEHLKLDPLFVRQYFGGVPVHRISLEEMRSVYLQQILAGHERLAEFIANRWLFRHMDVYRFFEEMLGKICPDFDKITELPVEQAQELVDQASSKFTSEVAFCFTILNDVALPQVIFDALQRQALEELAKRQKEIPEESGVSLLRAEMERVKEKHEKKIQEMTRKHQQEVQRLQREILDLKAELKKNSTHALSV